MRFIVALIVALSCVGCQSLGTPELVRPVLPQPEDIQSIRFSVEKPKIGMFVTAAQWETTETKDFSLVTTILSQCILKWHKSDGIYTTPSYPNLLLITTRTGEIFYLRFTEEGSGMVEWDGRRKRVFVKLETKELLAFARSFPHGSALNPAQVELR